MGRRRAVTSSVQYSQGVVEVSQYRLVRTPDLSFWTIGIWQFYSKFETDMHRFYAPFDSHPKRSMRNRGRRQRRLDTIHNNREAELWKRSRGRERPCEISMDNCVRNPEISKSLSRGFFPRLFMAFLNLPLPVQRPGPRPNVRVRMSSHLYLSTTAGHRQEVGRLQNGSRSSGFGRGERRFCEITA